MLHKQDNLAQTAFILFTLDELMPQEHYLREIAHAVDFKFIYDLVAPLYDLETGWALTSKQKFSFEDSQPII